MIQTQPMLEDFGGVQRTPGGGESCGGGSSGGMVGMVPPLHHIPQTHQGFKDSRIQSHPHHHHSLPHPEHTPHHSHTPHHAQHSHMGTDVYMKQVYNLSTLCGHHQGGPLTVSPPEKMSPTTSVSNPSLSPASSTVSGVSNPSLSDHLHHLAAYHGNNISPTGSALGNDPMKSPPALFRVASALPAKRQRGNVDDHPHPHHHHLQHFSNHHHQSDILRCKRRVDLSHKLGYKTHPTAVARRNERERNRVKHINSTFATLRHHIPCAAKNKKMSKVETLRSAIRYINHLQQILETQKAEEEREDGGGADDNKTNDEKTLRHGSRRHHGHLRLHHTPSSLHLFSPGGSSSVGSPGADGTSPTTRLNCDVTSVRMRSSVLLSPPGSPTSDDGRPGSADSHDMSPAHHYSYHDVDDVGDDMDDDVDDEEDEQNELTQFADWFV